MGEYSTILTFFLLKFQRVQNISQLTNTMARAIVFKTFKLIFYNLFSK